MSSRRGLPPFGLLLFIASGVLGLAASIPLSAGLTRLAHDGRLAHEGVMADGKVDSLELVTYSTSQPGSGSVLSSGGGSRRAMRVNYSFRAADNVVYHGSQT